MLLLAIDTSGKQGSIALALSRDSPGDENDIEIIAVAPLAGGTFSAQLVPQISDLLSGSGFTKYDVGALVVVAGPGSFTGLRIGLAAAKALAEVLTKPIASVSLLEVCAFVSSAHGKVMVVLDAGRGEVYVGEYETSVVADKVPKAPQEYLLGATEFIKRAKGWIVVTPDVSLANTAAENVLSVSVLTPISAGDVARLGWQKIQSGETVTPDQLEANYIRRTDAEMLEKSRA